MKAVILSFLLVLLTLYWSPTTESCSMPMGWKPPTVVERMKWSEVILYGKIMRIYRRYRSDTHYTAQMKVFCIVRGDPVNRIVNITNAGYRPGLCTNIELKKGRYLVGVNKQLDATEMFSYKAPNEIKEALKACGLNPPVYPIGFDKSTADRQCPAGLPAGKCKVD